MKRSEINSIIRESLDFLARMNYLLPPFAFWTPREWRAKGPECREIAQCGLGWDITDFGSGEFAKTGLFLFTLRNGPFAASPGLHQKTYAEKIMISRPGQATPTHFHFSKMEDIINRGGGELLIRLWNADDGERLADSPVTLSVDGVEKTFPPAGVLTLQPGESVCLPPRCYHTFWACEDKGPVLIGEVSRVNDDYSDNRFYEPCGRFAAIEEDEPPLYLLVNDYPGYYSYAAKDLHA